MGGCGSTKTHNKKISTNNNNNNVNQLSYDESAVLKLKQCRDQIKSFSKRLLDQEDKSRLKAKNFLKAGNKDRAKTALALSKMYKIQSENSNNQLHLIEEQIIQIEATKNQNQIYKALEQGNSVLKKLQNEVKIEDMERINEDMEDNRERHREMNEFFQSNGIDLVENDKAIEDELENILKAQADEINNELPNPNLNKRKEISEDNKINEKSTEKKEVLMN